MFCIVCFIFFSFSLGNRVFRRFLKFFFLTESLRTQVAFLFLFVSSIVNLLQISVKRNFYLHFFVHFSFYHIIYDVAQQLWIKNAANVRRLNNWKATFILWWNEPTLMVCDTPAFQLKFRPQTGSVGCVSRE